MSFSLEWGNAVIMSVAEKFGILTESNTLLRKDDYHISR